MIIDIAKREAARALDTGPLVTFRRTEADRRPARRFVQPNDGPDPDRFAKAEEIRARLKRKKLAGFPGLSPSTEKAVEVLADGGMKLADLADAIGGSIAAARNHMGYARTAALVEKTSAGIYRLTERGRQWLERDR